MSGFFTEFPVTKIIKPEDIYYIALQWLSGVKGSSFFGKDLAENFPFSHKPSEIFGGAGELIAFEYLSFLEKEAFGFRHQRKDAESRLWATELVLVKGAVDAVVTVRVHCLQGELGAKIETPKKPYIIKMLLEASFGGVDIDLEVSDTAHSLDVGELEKASKILGGHATISIPVVYISRNIRGKLLVDADKLAFDLGGLAHVVVEPSNRFSFELRDKCADCNPYNGVVALCLQGRGIVKRYFPPAYGGDSKFDIATAIRRDIARITSNRPSNFGWDWSDLQAEIGRRTRDALQSVSEQRGVDDYIAAFDKELQAKDDEIERLKRQLEAVQQEEASRMAAEIGIINPDVLDAIPEVFVGEISDRVRFLIERAIENESYGLSSRDKFVFSRILTMSEYSGNAVRLAHKIKAAGRDSNKACREISEILGELGFDRSDDGKHVRLAPPSGLGGVDSITLAKTPSDHRSGKNEASQIIGGLGLVHLKS